MFGKTLSLVEFTEIIDELQRMQRLTIDDKGAVSYAP